MKPESENTAPDVTPVPKKATLLQVIRIVISMLFMVGRNRDYGSNAPVIDPVKLIFVAIIGTVLVIAGLVTLAMFIAH
jgi:hypothetical protein